MHPAITLFTDLRSRGITLVPETPGHVRVTPSDQLVPGDRDTLHQYHSQLWAITQGYHVLWFHTTLGIKAEVVIDQCDEAGYLTAQTVWMFPLPPGTIAYMEWYQGAQLLREERLEKTATMPRPQPSWLV
ncbi:MAG: hypothetical protein M1294_13905 [Firmicutes bacterium]|jgi:hypothetical protein|nr:hypothetical protein [Bacillota bacterium]MCL5012832.1 hypothetical protein [Bacillota bacterium]